MHSHKSSDQMLTSVSLNRQFLKESEKKEAKH